MADGVLDPLIPWIGPLIALIFFLINYRRSIGVREARRRAAHKEVVQTTARLIADDKATVTPESLADLRSSKARQHDLPDGYLPTLPIVFEDVVAGFQENEFIPTERRNQLILRLSQLKTEHLEKKVLRPPENDKQSVYRFSLQGLLSTIVRTLLASVFIAIATVLAFSLSPILPLAITFAVVGLLSALAFLRLRLGGLGGL